MGAKTDKYSIADGRINSSGPEAVFELPNIACGWYKLHILTKILSTLRGGLLQVSLRAIVDVLNVGMSPLTRWPRGLLTDSLLQQKRPSLIYSFPSEIATIAFLQRSFRAPHNRCWPRCYLIA